MNRRFRAELAAERFIGALAITSLTFMLVWVPEPVCHTDEREMLVELAVDDLLRHRDDRLGAPRVERCRVRD